MNATANIEAYYIFKMMTKGATLQMVENASNWMISLTKRIPLSILTAPNVSVPSFRILAKFFYWFLSLSLLVPKMEHVLEHHGHGWIDK